MGNKTLHAVLEIGDSDIASENIVDTTPIVLHYQIPSSIKHVHCSIFEWIW